MRRWACLILVLGWLGVLCIGGWCQDIVTLTTWSIPTHNSLPQGLALTSDGRVFVAQFVGGSIGELNPTTNVVTERVVFGAPFDVCVYNDHYVYWTDSVADRLGELSIDTGAAFAVQLPSSRGLARAIALGEASNGLDAVWFLERDGNRLTAHTLAGGRTGWFPQAPVLYSIEATRTDTQLSSDGFRVLQPSTRYLYSEPAIAARAVYDGSSPKSERGFEIWDLPDVVGGRPCDLVTDVANRRIIISTETNMLMTYDMLRRKFTLYSLPAGTSTHGLMLDNYRRIWYTDKRRSRISRFDFETGELIEYQLPSIGWPQNLELVQRGELLVFTEWASNKIGAIDLRTNELRRYELPISMSRPLGIAADTTHISAAYFTAERGNYIGRIEFPAQ